jgi:hypothetical protein
MAATKIILKKDIYNIIHLNIGAFSNEEKKKIVLDYACLQSQIDKNNTSIDIQETVNAINYVYKQSFLTSKI